MTLDASLPAPARFTLADFLKKSQQDDQRRGLFELEGPRMLEVNLAGRVWMKMGAMVAYRGAITFTREGALEHGLGNLLKKAVTGEGLTLTKAEGNGQLYLADGAKRITVLQLEGEGLCVNGNDILAFEPTLTHEIVLLRKVAALMAGGLFNVRFQGKGLVALTTQGEPLTLAVTPDSPVMTDPNATVAWSANLQPEFRTDVSLKTFLGRGSGESLQMVFRGQGFVVIQPFEEIELKHTQE